MDFAVRASMHARAVWGQRTFLPQLTMLPWLIVGDKAGIFSTS